MAFKPFKNYIEQDTETYIIKNSVVLNVGDPVYFDGSAASGGFINLAGSNSNVNVYGVVMGFVGSDGVPQQTNSFTATSTNQTVALVRARVLPVRDSRLFVADLSQAAATTSGSADPGFFALSAVYEGKLDETTYVVSTGSKKQFYSIGAGGGLGNNVSQGLQNLSSTQVAGYFVNIPQ